MKTVFFLLLRLICYPALAIVVAAGVALIVVSVNGQCPRITARSASPARQGFRRGSPTSASVLLSYTLDTGFPIVLAAGGLIFFLRDMRRRRSQARV